jgi:Leucine-rich repeat (LRR) protein
MFSFLILLASMLLCNGNDYQFICELKHLNPGSNLTFPAACSYPNGCSACTTAQGITFNTDGKITQMNLNNKKLTAIPSHLGSLTFLTTLYLGENPLSTVPEAISSLTGLEVLGMNNNHLTTLPPLESLTLLNKLNLGYNQLQSIPEVVGSLTFLTGLYASFSLTNISVISLNHL